MPPVKLTSNAFADQVARLCSAGPVRFIPNPGNAGDGVINATAWQLFENLGVVRSMSGARDGAAGVIYVFSGGGSLIPRYIDARREIESRLSDHFASFLILPHTIRGNEDLLARMDERFHVFCRDIETHSHVRASAPRANAYLADDLVFNLDLSWVLSPSRRVLRLMRLLLQPRAFKRYVIWRMAIRKIAPSDGVLKVLRVDVESASDNVANPDFDLSAQYGSDFASRYECELVAGDFVRTIGRAKRVVTDRLHVAICGSLLGREVDLLDNNYGKNRALYELSMRDRYPRTRFLGVQL